MSSPLQPSCSAAFASKLSALRDNVLRYYDLCLLVRQSQEEMKLLNEQFEDIADAAMCEDSLEWLLSGIDGPACREWEAANPGWMTTGKGIRKRVRKHDDPSVGTTDSPPNQRSAAQNESAASYCSTR